MRGLGKLLGLEQLGLLLQFGLHSSAVSRAALPAGCSMKMCLEKKHPVADLHGGYTKANGLELMILRYSERMKARLA